MQIFKERKKYEVINIFKKCDDFITYISESNYKINFDDKLIIEKINFIYDNMLKQDGIIKLNRFSRWLHGQFGFKKSNLLVIDYWLERGWDEEYGKNMISNICKERSKLGSKTKLEIKNIIEFNGENIKIKFKSAEFNTNTHPKCNICNNNLDLIKTNINNSSKLFYYKIKGCSNETCKSKSLNKNEQYRAFLPKDIYEDKIKELNDIITNYNRLSIKSWVNKGYTEEEAKEIISEIQSKNSLMVKNRFIASKENLLKSGYTEEQIKQICLTPSNNQFWVNKGYTEEESINKVKVNQINATKYIDYENRLLPSNIDYWIERGFTEQQAKKNITERQKTFSLEICIEKYGCEDGLKRFNERQIKWLTNYKKSNYSKISQRLFWGIVETDPTIKNNDIYFATYNKGVIGDSNKNNEYRLSLNNGVILPDFFDLNSKKIIEFDGTYYHRITPENSLREEKRNKMIIESGYEVLHISEHDFKKNKEEVINKCIKFLKDK
jgi:hypothetical protein